SLPAWPHPFANRFLAGDPGLTFRVSATGASLGEANTTVRQTSAPAPSRSTPFDAPRAALWVWAFGAAFSLSRMLSAYRAVSRIRRDARPSIHSASDFGIGEPVSLLETQHGMPMTAGIFRPAIFLPAGSAFWTADRTRIVVLHEYAHILRGDAASQLVAQLALCLHWFNPLAWFAWREFLKERERAADDLVLFS